MRRRCFIRKHWRRDGHLDTMAAMNDLAGVSGKKRKLEEAEKLYKEVLEKITGFFGRGASWYTRHREQHCLDIWGARMRKGWCGIAGGIVGEMKTEPGGQTFRNAQDHEQPRLHVLAPRVHCRRSRPVQECVGQKKRVIGGGAGRHYSQHPMAWPYI